MIFEVGSVSNKTGIGPLCASCGDTSYDQLLQRMKDEAVSDSSDLCKLKHLLAALATSPNGRAKVQFLDLLRSGGIKDSELRRLLGLNGSLKVIDTDEDLGGSEAVCWIIGEAVKAAGLKARRPETSDVLNALIKHFQSSTENGTERAEVRLISAIRDGSIKDL